MSTSHDISRRSLVKAGAAATAVLGAPGLLLAQAKPVKIGLVHPVSGGLAYSGAQARLGALMAIDEKRDRLRQMIEGVIPTKVTKRRDGTVEAVFDMLGALVADAKMAGEFDGTAAVKEPEIKLEFEMYHRNHPNPPREWLNRALVVPKVISES